MPILYYQIHHNITDGENIDRLLNRAKKFILRGTIWLMVTMYLCLGLALDSTLPTPLAYVVSFVPFIFLSMSMCENCLIRGEGWDCLQLIVL